MESMVAEEMNGDSTSQREETNNSSSPKCCADCKTTKTPLWRGGPSGPKSLCNACGIRYRKKRVSVGSFPSTTTSPDRKPDVPSEPQVPTPAGSDTEKGLNRSVKTSLVLLGEDFLLHTSAVAKKQRCQRKRKLREEELAAVSLMALSCGSVFA